MAVNLDFLLERYGVVKSTIGEWVKKNPEMKLDRNQYDLAACDLVFINKLREENKRLSSVPENLPPDNPHARLVIAQCRKTEAEAGIKELELEKLRGSVLTFTEARDDLWEAWAKTKVRLIALPSIASVKLAGMDNARSIESYLLKLVNQILDELKESFRDSVIPVDPDEE